MSFSREQLSADDVLPLGGKELMAKLNGLISASMEYEPTLELITWDEAYGWWGSKAVRTKVNAAITALNTSAGATLDELEKRDLLPNHERTFRYKVNAAIQWAHVTVNSSSSSGSSASSSSSRVTYSTSSTEILSSASSITSSSSGSSVSSASGSSGSSVSSASSASSLSSELSESSWSSASPGSSRSSESSDLSGSSASTQEGI